MKNKDKIIVKKPFAGVQKGVVLALCVMLAGSFFSCSKRAEAGGEVPYIPCACEEGESMQKIEPADGSPVVMNAYLFKDFVPEGFFPKELIVLPHEEQADWFLRKVYYIIYDSEMDMACLYMNGFMGGAMDRICNFPDFAKEWNIPAEGCNVYFTGTFYEPCKHVYYQKCCGWDASQHGGFRFSNDFILTSLKRK